MQPSMTKIEASDVNNEEGNGQLHGEENRRREARDGVIGSLVCSSYMCTIGAETSWLIAAGCSSILDAPKIKEANWRTTIFQTLVTCEHELLKLVIDCASCMNVISASVVE